MDEADAVGEENETNNQLIRRALKPDEVTPDLQLDEGIVTASIRADNHITFTYAVQDLSGNENIPDTKISLHVSPNETGEPRVRVCSPTFSTIDAGPQGWIQSLCRIPDGIDWPFVVATVDPANVVDEVNETNNQLIFRADTE